MMQTSFYSWIRKGLGGQITEPDNLGRESGTIKKRPAVQLTANIETVSCNSEKDVANSEKSHRYESKTISLSGPGDVVSLNASAIARIFPNDGTETFPKNGFPYVEFWEPDFAWRYTPAKACENDKKLRPWLTLVVCKVTECSVRKTSWGVDIVSFNVDDQGYENLFPSQENEVWKSAHVQGEGGDQICRVLGLRNDLIEEKNEDAEYRAFLIPVFEVGRLRGIHGPDYDEKNLDDISAQQSAWEENLGLQRERHKDQPLTFPSYYSWTFKRKGLSFAVKVKSLTRNDSPKSGIDVDVTSLGEGLDYAVLGEKKGRRNKISMPAALTTIGNVPEAVYPNPNNEEKDVYKNLNSLLSKSPVFEENTKIIKGEGKKQAVDEDDPWITPPIYGGKHVLATSLKDEDNEGSPWLKQVNMDLHYRAAAGLGKKAVQRNQEELVNRAWQQIDAVKSLNAEMNQKMLSANVNDSVKYLNYKWVGGTNTKISGKREETEFLSQMMMNLPSMRNTSFGKDSSGDDVSLNSVLSKKGIPNIFVSDSFRRTAEKTLENASYPDLVQSIAEQQIYVMQGAAKAGTLSKEELESFTNTTIVPYLCKFFVEQTDLKEWFIWNEDRKYISILNLVGALFITPKERIRCFWGGSTFSQVMMYYKQNRENLGDIASMDLFFDNRLWEINTVGYTSSTIPSNPDGVSWNIYALDNFVFKSLFYLNDNDEKIITVVKIKSSTKWYYFINRDRVDRDRVNSNGDGITYYGNMADSNASCCKLDKPPVDLKDSILELRRKRRERIYEASIDGSWDEMRWKLCAYCLLYTPNRIVAPADVLDDIVLSGGGYSFENASQFYQKLILNYVSSKNNDEKDKNIRLYNAWCNLQKCIGEVGLTPDPEMPKYKGAIDDVEKLKGGLRDDSVYDRLKECATTYYNTFFSDKNLVQKYLEDCLASKYPIKAYPIFPEPTYYYLRDIADEFILPGIEELPDDSISVFVGDASFVESFLCGMNTEMGRELLWREYPTDQRGSYFKKFWDSATSIEDIKKDNFFDVQSLHRWTGNLGKNHMDSKDVLLFFAIKGDLMKLYPDTNITLRKSAASYIGNKLTFGIVNGVSVENKGILEPVSQGFVRDDVYVVGFQIAAKDALGCPPKEGDKNVSCGYMLVFEKAKENIEFVLKPDEIKSMNKSDNAADFASICLDTTTIVGKHVSTLIGRN